MGLMEFFTRHSVAPTSAAAASPVEREQVLASLLALAWVVEARDPYTGGHLWRVSRYAALLCEQAGLSVDEGARIAIGGFLHDLGKIGVPDAVLRKPDKLTDDEFALIRTHPTVGARLLAGHPLAELVRHAVLLHHERPDGHGYPSGIAGTDIPLAACVVGVCDAFDAMTSSRPYRASLPITHALGVIRTHAGSQFDATLASHFLALGAEGLLDHIAGHSDDGIPLQRCRMCDAGLVVRREQRAGDALFCRNCGAGYRLESGQDDPLLQATPTGERGSAADLEPRADAELIGRFVRDTAARALNPRPTGRPGM